MRRYGRRTKGKPRAQRRNGVGRLLPWLLALFVSCLGGGALAADAEPEVLVPGDAPMVAPEHRRLPPVPKGFNTYDGEWIHFFYHPSVRERVQPLIGEADAVKHDLVARLGQFGRPVLTDVHVYIARTAGEMSSLAPEGAPFPDYAAGVAYSELGLVLLTIAPVHSSSRHDLLEIFRHELAHVALHQAVGGRHVPRWFNEGFAVFASGEGSVARLQTLWTATLADTLLPLSDLDRMFPADADTASIAYAEAADVLRFLLRREDRHRFSNLISRLAEGHGFERALEDAYGTDLRILEHEWREDVARRYTFWPVLLSGTVVWLGIVGLFVMAYRRRRRRNRETMARWAREEAAEEDTRQRAAARQSAARLHIVLTPAGQRPSHEEIRPGLEADVPKVEHEGQWHTLH